jgi:hypothetical protein
MTVSVRDLPPSIELELFRELERAELRRLEELRRNSPRGRPPSLGDRR